ncbi:hypothetical protein Syun_029688 [Stephania yunnanensis]|uniref:Uncharacterized protein n=1 Tax=Stephania yunnanensis TaxID=152371 RepID=A0AAP0EEB8_9MAGN
MEMVESNIVLIMDTGFDEIEDWIDAWYVGDEISYVFQGDWIQTESQRNWIPH